ncbi:MAG: phospholipase D-like domain-containing protein [Candidatus Thiodiazotropha sp.]
MFLLGLHLATLFGGLLAVLLIADILRIRRTPASTLGWLLFMITLPWLAIPIYLGLGRRKHAVAQPRPSQDAVPVVEACPWDSIDRLMAREGVSPSSHGNRLVFHKDGTDALSALTDLLSGARRELNISMFLLADDSLGRGISQALRDAVQRGVQVRLLLDGVGSFLLPKRMVRDLLRAGIQVAWFTPLLHRPFRGYNNLRNHRKLVIADGNRAWLGGRNLADEYFSESEHWIDLSFELEGPAIEHLTQIFIADWSFATRENLKMTSAPEPTGEACVQVLASGPDRPDEPLRDMLLTSLYQAHSRIIAVTPYYVPDENLQRALCLAAKRGISVKLILPLRSNHRLADYTRTRYLRELTESGVEVRLVPGAMVHAKALVIDDNLGMAGSANLDLRSLFLNYELVCLFRSNAEITALSTWIEGLSRHTLHYSPKPAGRLRDMAEGVVQLFAFQL